MNIDTGSGSTLVYSPLRAEYHDKFDHIKPRCHIAPRASATTLPCSDESKWASSSIGLHQANSEHDRARFCGLVAASRAAPPLPGYSLIEQNRIAERNAD
jgi:hypothetical protein